MSTKYWNNIVFVISVVLLSLPQVVFSQNLQPLDSLSNTSGKAFYLIIYGQPSCHECVPELYNYLITTIDSSQVLVLALTPKSPVFMRNILNDLHKELGIPYSQVYFTRDLAPYFTKIKESKNQYPMLIKFNNRTDYYLLEYNVLFSTQGIKTSNIMNLIYQ